MQFTNFCEMQFCFIYAFATELNGAALDIYIYAYINDINDTVKTGYKD